MDIYSLSSNFTNIYDLETPLKLKYSEFGIYRQINSRIKAGGKRKV